VPIIILDATSGKCSGDVIIDFPPRLVQQMRVVIACRAGQTSFALRSFNAYKRSYQSSGMVTSQPIYLSSTSAEFAAEQVTPARTLPSPTRSPRMV